MIKIKAEFSTSQRKLRNIRRALRDTDRLAEQSIRQEAAVVGRAAIRELTKPAPEVKYPIVWASEKQRRAFFATNGFGRGIPTQRTGAVQKAWRYEINRTNNGFRFTLVNTKPYAKFLFGSLAQNARQAARFQQPMHRDTGYPLASPIAKEAIDSLTDRIRTNTVRSVATEIRRRAQTG